MWGTAMSPILKAPELAAQVTDVAPVYTAPSYRVELWTPDECAWQLRMAPGTLRNLGKHGPPKVKLGGRVWYRPEAVEAWLKNRER